MTNKFSIPCECGKDVAVGIADAGGEKLCDCGRTLNVPRLSELRKSVGQDPFESNVLDTVRRELREQDNRIGDTCLHSGRPTGEKMWVELICERKQIVTKKESGRDWRGVFFLFGGLAYTFSRLWADDSQTPDTQEFGHDRSISLPLPIAAEFHESLSNKKLLKYLKQIPQYRRIFNEYPDAVVSSIQQRQGPPRR